MAKSYNQVVLMGNLTRDPELRQTPNGQSVVSMALALNRSYKVGEEWQEETTYIDVVAWGRQAEQVAESLHKGSPVLVNGRLQSRKWVKEDQGQETTHTKVEVIANDVTFLEKEARDNG